MVKKKISEQLNNDPSIALFNEESGSVLDAFIDDSIHTERQEGHPFNRDDHNFYFRKLYSDLINSGSSVDTYENYLKKGIKPTHIIFIDIPKNINILKSPNLYGVKKIVYFSECVLFKPWNYDDTYYDLFDYILTWSDEVLKKASNAIRINNHFCYTDENLNNFNKYFSIKPKKLCVLIASNKNSTHPLELYSSRKSVLEWFEKNQSEHFDLFGYDWDKRYIRSPKILRILNRLKIFTHTGSSVYKCYKGETDSKIKTMANYKFSICFENARLISGYLTEKIFDSMISGSVPVYLGDPSIEKHIPSSCYIKYDDFNSNDELFEYMLNMTNEEYNNYLGSIKSFLKSPYIKKYSALNFSKTFIRIITKDD